MKIRVYFVGCVVSICLGLSGCATLTELAKRPVNKGQAAGLYDGNQKILYDAKHKAKTSEEAMRLGNQALRDNDTDQALYQFVTAYELDASQYMALYKVGLIQAGKGHLNRAALAFNMVLKAKPDQAETLIELGLVELRMRRYERAEKHIKRGIEMDAGSWRGFDGLAILSDLKKDFKSSQQYYDKALQLNPTSPMIWNNRGYSRYLAGDWGDAERYIHKALDIDPEYEKAWLNLGLIDVRRGSYDSALVAFGKVMKKAKAYQQVGSLAMMEGKYDVAEYFLNRAIDASPQYYDEAYKELDRLETMRGRTDDHNLDSGAGDGQAGPRESRRKK